MAEPKPHPANAPGDFYVEDGCCATCEVPLLEAPNLFGWAEQAAGDLHCYVKRQPQTAAELDAMIMTIRCSELSCIRYRGTDRAIHSRLVEVGEGMVCDELPSNLRRQAEEMEAEWRQRREQIEAERRQRRE
jgi:hypothetical protein